MSDNARVMLDKDFLSLSMGISERPILHEIFSEYLANLQEVILVLGEEKVEPDRLYMYVHRLKSSSAAVGAVWLTEKFAEMEAQIHAGLDHLLLLPGLDAACRETMAVIAGHLQSISV